MPLLIRGILIAGPWGSSKNPIARKGRESRGDVFVVLKDGYEPDRVWIHPLTE